MKLHPLLSLTPRIYTASTILLLIKEAHIYIYIYIELVSLSGIPGLRIIVTDHKVNNYVNAFHR